MPPTKKAKLASPVEDLPVSLLAKIFGYLDLADRFQIAAVCKRWFIAARVPWTDIKLLNLESIPSSKINAILALCPLTRQMFAKNNRIVLEEGSARPNCDNLLSMKLFDVRFTVADTTGCKNKNARKYQRLLSEYFTSFPRLEELVWYNIFAVEDEFEKARPGHKTAIKSQLPYAMPQALKRLAVVNSTIYDLPCETLPGHAALQDLPGLECLYLGGPICPYESSRTTVLPDLLARWWNGLENMRNLRELCLAPAIFAYCVDFVSLKKLATVACKNLLSLEVLMYASYIQMSHEGLAELITSHPSLKILVVAGSDSNLEVAYEEAPQSFVPVSLPQRKLRPAGPDTTRLPFLNIFIGGEITRFFRFAVPQTGAANFHKIDSPMTQFLTKPEIAPLFEGIWLAEMIRDGGCHGVEPWGGPDDLDVFVSTLPLSFYDPNAQP